MTLAAIDLGASGGKVLAGWFVGERLTTREVHRFANDPVQAGDTLYWDILRLLHEVKNGIRAVHALGGDGVTSIGLDTWGVDFGLLDRDHRLVGNPLHYRDPSHLGAMEAVLDRVPAAEIFQRTGVQFIPLNTLFQLYALRETAALANAETLLLIPDLLRFLLTGERVSEFTNVSTTQMMRIASRAWDTDLLDRLGLPSRLLTGIVEPASSGVPLTPAARRELETGSALVTPVGSHDTASAVAATPANSDFAFLSSGTWALLGIETHAPVVTEQARRWNFSNEGGLAGTWQLLKNIVGMWLIERCRVAWNRAGTPVSYDALPALVAAAPPFAAFINPDDHAFLNPPDMPAAIREFCRGANQPPPKSPGAIARVILESMALTARQVLERAETLTGKRVPGLHIVGGGARNETFLQFVANAIGRPVWAGPIEATAIGNLLGQLLASGELANLAEARAVVRASFPVITHEPEDISAWDEAYHRFCTAVRP